ncbi:diacylglycerol kinase [Patescibacteria group bacterium]|nr:diacylglycerol kinase [Patescibacteria group bacterium]
MVNFLQKDALDTEIKKNLNVLGLRIRGLLKSRHSIRRVDSFKYAFKGVYHALINEPNFRIQILIVLITAFLGFYFGISTVEWGLLVISGGLLLSAEMINTVMEELMDHLIPEESPIVAIIKDLSAGFVLTMAGTYLVILFLVFFNHILVVF